MRRLSTTILAVLVASVTSAAAAQTPPVVRPRPNRVAQPAPANRDSQPPRARRAGPPDPNSRPGLGGPASNLLRMRQQLELTDDQVRKLESLQLAPRPELNQAEMLRARADLMDASKGDVNLEKARAALDRMARVRTDAQIAQMKSRQELRNVLTPGQRAKLDAFGRGMRERQGAAMRGRANQRMGQGRGQRPGMGPDMGPGMGPDMGPGMGMGNRMNRPTAPPRPPMQPQRVRPPTPPSDSIR